jgi:hypothetical protein
MDRPNEKFLAILTDALHLLVKQNKDAKVNLSFFKINSDIFDRFNY